MQVSKAQKEAGILSTGARNFLLQFFTNLSKLCNPHAYKGQLLILCCSNTCWQASKTAEIYYQTIALYICVFYHKQY